MAKSIPGPGVRKVNAGDPLRFYTDDQHAMADAANAFRAQTHGRKVDVLRTFQQSGIVWVKNASGGDRDRFDVLGIDGPLFSPTKEVPDPEGGDPAYEDDAPEEFQNRVVLTCSEPADPTHVGRFVILLEPLAEGFVGRACISGVCPAKLAVGDYTHGFADIIDGDPSSVQAGHHGAAQILWIDDTGSAVEWAIIRLGLPSMFRWFELKDALTLGGYADAYLLEDTYSVDEDVIFEVHDQPMGMFAGWSKETSPARNGARGLAMYSFSSAQWEVIQMQHVARSITFTLTETMDAGQASCTVDDYYRGVDPDIVFTTVKVYDPQMLFGWALNGAKGKATLDDRSNEYHITECDRIARLINFTTTEYIGETEALYAEVTIDAYYHGQDPEIYFDSPATLRVKDAQGNFLRVLSGAKGLAHFDDEAGEYYIVECQQMSMMIKCTADDDYDAGETVGISVPVLMNPPDGMDPEGSAMPSVDPVANGVENNTGQPVKSGDTLFIAWNEEEDQWELLIGADEPTLKWAKAQGNWEEAHAANGTAVDLHPHVSCKDCNSAGTLDDAGQAAFDVLLPRKRAKNAGLDPSVYTDDVILYRIDEEGSRVCETPYLFSFIGEVRQSADVNRIPTGWHICDEDAGTILMIGKFPRGLEGAENPGAEGGDDIHGGGTNDHEPNPHPNHRHEMDTTLSAKVDSGTDGSEESYDAGGAAFTTGAVAEDGGDPPEWTHGETDNKPLYTALFYIQRIS